MSRKRSTNRQTPNRGLMDPVVTQLVEEHELRQTSRNLLDKLRLVNKQLNANLKRECESELRESLKKPFESPNPNHKSVTSQQQLDTYTKCLNGENYSFISNDTNDMYLDYKLWSSPGLWKSHILCQIRKSLYRDKRAVVTFAVLPETIDIFVQGALQHESTRCILKNFTTRIYVMNTDDFLQKEKERKREKLRHDTEIEREMRGETRGGRERRENKMRVNLERMEREIAGRREETLIATIKKLRDGLKTIKRKKPSNHTELQENLDIDNVKIGIGRQGHEGHDSFTAKYSFTDEVYKSVQLIGQDAFRYMTGFAQSPESPMFTALTHIGDRAFMNLRDKPDFTNLVNLTHIGDLAFFKLKETPDFTNLVNLTHIGNGAFFELTMTPDFKNLANLTHIGDRAFINLRDKPDVTNLVNLTHIGDSAFLKLKETPDFQNLVKLMHIGKSAFLNVEKVPDFTNLRELKYIGNQAFTELRETPDFQNLVKLMHIGDAAFLNVKEAPNFTKLANLTHIGDRAFATLEETPDFTDLKALMEIGSRAFRNVTVTDTLKDQLLNLARNNKGLHIAKDAFPDDIDEYLKKNRFYDPRTDQFMFY